MKPILGVGGGRGYELAVREIQQIFTSLQFASLLAHLQMKLCR